MEPTTRRVPLRTLWIKGIRTIWQLRKELLVLWFLTVALPVTAIELWLAPVAADVVEQIQASVSAFNTTQIPVITQIIGITSPFIVNIFAAYGAMFLLGSLGWMATLLVVHRYFQGFPPYAPIELLKAAATRLLLGNYLVLMLGGVFGLAGIIGFPILDLVAIVVLMIPTYQIATNGTFFKSIGGGMKLRYASHFKGGRFLSLVQMALLSIGVSTAIIGTIQLSNWIFLEISPFLTSRQVISDVLVVPKANQLFVVVRNAIVCLILLLVPTLQMTLYYWLYSIPRLFTHEGIKA